ncbi:MAG: alcohol dehydrogenase catalytic domain-containing protein [Chloroflexi bacterium]|nr:alcohol dehydrogenase catalytic domain-containing protein [Chloroflexota bacterium]
MKALIRVPGGVEVAEQPDPVASPEEVVVAVHSCGICGSDVHAAEANTGESHGIPGHEFSGTVADIGRDVSGWRVGQPVAVNPLGGCGQCEWCQREMLIRCTGRPNLGLSAPGGFAEYVAAHHSQLFAVPQGMPLECGSRVEPTAVGLRAIREAGSPAGLNAIVFGVGPIGLFLIQGLRALGAGTIIAVGRSSAGRKAAAARIGADVVLDSRETDVADYVAEREIEVAQAYECSADPQALVVLGRAVRGAGSIVMVALPREPVYVDARRLVTGGQHLVGACAFGAQDYAQSLELISSGKVNVEPLISERLPLAAAPEAFVRLRHPGDLVSVLVQPGL